jgi:hypothetical protein
MKTNRDLFVLVFCTIWFITNITVYLVTHGSDVINYINWGFAGLFSIAAITDRLNKNFHNWLNIHF